MKFVQHDKQLFMMVGEEDTSHTLRCSSFLKLVFLNWVYYRSKFRL